MRDGKAFLKVSLLKSYSESLAKDGVEINMADVVVGKDDKQYVRMLTRFDGAHHYKSLAENLQMIRDGRRMTGF